MRQLSAPGTKIFEHKGEMFKLLAIHTDNNYDKEKLGYLVAYYGGNKIVKTNGKLWVCKTIEEAELVT